MNELKVQEKLSIKEARQLYKKSGQEMKQENSTSFVSLSNVNKIYPNGVQAVYDFNLEIDQHDFVALVGPSGCGKSTTLRMIAGLEDITMGYLYIDKVLSNYLPSKDRDIAMVFQSYALYPQMTVYENIAFGLEIRKIDKKEIEKRVFSAAKILDLGHYLDRRPKELSGGQMQRVALGRAIVREAQLFLMDEPLSNLDAKLRVQMRSEIVRIHEEVGATTIYVTHDQIEAMTMANKIVVMNKGFIQQIGKPMEIYEDPANLFVATFIGSPAMNILEAIYRQDSIQFKDGFKIQLPSSFKKIHDTFYQEKITLCEEILQKIDTLGKEEIMKIQSSQVFSKNETLIEGEFKYQKKKSRLVKMRQLFTKKEKVVLVVGNEKEDFKNQIYSYLTTYKSCLKQEHAITFGIRPEHISLVSKGLLNSSSEPFTMKTSIVEILGSEFIVHGEFNGSHLTAKLDSSTYVKSHSTVELTLDVSKVHLFDPISGEKIK